MSKIVRFKTPQDQAIETLEELLARAKAGEFHQFIFAAQLDGAEIATTWCNSTVSKRQELLSHLQCDVMYAIVEANMDRLVEYV